MINRERTKDILEEILNEISPTDQRKTENKMLLAARIMDAIKAKGWGKSQFAEVIGVKPSVVTKWVSGTHNFTIDTLSEIEMVLDVKLLNTKERVEILEEGVVHVVYNGSFMISPKIVEQKTAISASAFFPNHLGAQFNPPNCESFFGNLFTGSSYVGSLQHPKRLLRDA